jgi:hypothetical protein
VNFWEEVQTKAQFRVVESMEDVQASFHIDALFAGQIHFPWWLRLLFRSRKIPLPDELITTDYLKGKKLVKILKGRLWKWKPDQEDVVLIWEFSSQNQELLLHTYVWCRNRFSYRRFKNYWNWVYLFSKLFRILTLRSIVRHPCKPS